MKQQQILRRLFHDVFNQLAIAQGKAQIGLRGNPESKEFKVIVESIKQAAKYLAEAKIHVENPQIEKTSAAQALIDTADEFRRMSDAYCIEFSFDSDASRLGVSAAVDLSKYLRVVENLVSNAHTAGATKIQVTDRVIDRKIRTEWRDNGGGCKEINLIGTGWSSRQEDGDFHGEGTSLMRDLIESMGGTIEWKEEVDGINVIISVPVVD